jgi:hypothetical protein
VNSGLRHRDGCETVQLENGPATDGAVRGAPQVTWLEEGRGNEVSTDDAPDTLLLFGRRTSERVSGIPR